MQKRRDIEEELEAQPSIHQTYLVGRILRSLHSKRMDQSELICLENRNS